MIRIQDLQAHGDWPYKRPPEWTKLTFLCRDCGDLCYIGAEAIDDTRDNWEDPKASDEDVANSFEFCLSCSMGDEVEGEKVFTVGTRVRLRREVDRYPHFVARAGMTGTVVERGDEVLVKMDEHLEGAEEWENCVMWFHDSRRWVHLDLEVIAAEAR